MGKTRSVVVDLPVARGRPLLSAEAWRYLRAWYRANGRHSLPWRSQPTPWSILVAETLLHRTRAEAAGNLYPQVLREFPGPEEVVLNENRWLQITRSVGLAWRGRAFVDACRTLITHFCGQVPRDRASLMGLPGVGHYVADAVRCFGFGIPGVIVDSNTIRLASRISGEALETSWHRTGRARAAVSLLADGSNPPDADDNYALLDLAALVCRKPLPDSQSCPIRHECTTGRFQPEGPVLQGSIE